MAEQPPKTPGAQSNKTEKLGETGISRLGPAPRVGDKPLGPSPRPIATPPPGVTPRSSADVLTPSPAEAVKPSRTAHDRGLEVRMAIGHAETAPHADGENLEIDPGMRLRQYELIRELGRGGMGQVFLARDVKLARRVAIKFLSTASRELTERFLREARTTAAVNHENIVVIHEVDEHAGMPHMVLEYLEGTSLRDLMRGRAYSAGRVVELIVPVVRAVARAHAAGIVHRDLKPENIFVTIDGAIKVLDFGIAKALVDPDAVPHKANASDLEHLAKDALTGKSAIIGTPQYMSPEQFGLDVVDHRSDIWALGIMMFELLTGKHPLAPFTIHSLLTAAANVDERMPAIGSVVHDLPEKLERIVDRCLAKRKGERFSDAKSLLAELESLVPGKLGRKLRDDESPYPGLSAFQEDDADRFFGRGREVMRLQTRLRDHGLLAIAGPSGVGKSSFVRAGIVPALKRMGETWETYILRPGRQPMASLAGVLAPLISASGEGVRTTNPNALADYETLVARLTAEPGYLGQLLRERAARKNAHVLLFVDQFEELYTLVPDEAQRRAFTACLAGAADDASSPIRIICSLRSDFLDRVAEDRAFLDELMRGLIFLQPLGRPELREALSRPLDAHGYRYESDELLEQMLDELAAVPGALPLLQYAGARLWDARDRKNKVLTASAHAAMGGIAGALATHADQFLAGLPADSHRLVRAIFQRLVTPERTRAIAELEDLEALATDPADTRRIIDQLVAARLLVVQVHGETGGASVEIVHESLLDAWPTLRRWLDEDQEDAAFLAQLATAAKQWESKGRAQGLLWRGDAMLEAQRWAKTRARRLPDRDQAYLDAVLALARRTRRVRFAAVVAAFAVMTAIAGGASFAYTRVRAANEVAEHQRQVAEKALVDKIAEETARRQAEDQRTAALASLLTEEQLRKAAEDGLITAEQLAQIAEIQKRVAQKKLVTSEQQRNQLAEQLRKSEAEKRAAEAAAQQKSAEAQMTREQLVEKNQQLEAALSSAKTAREKAEALRADSDRISAQLKQALAAKQAEVERLEKERKKITTDLK
ncbi:MAG TPA: protein kinase [Kofleriaceae bacterium]|nr:protein kinase [Kofleriaceae bacterium]